MSDPAHRSGSHPRRNILIDLTPVMPGGANGGAKLVALAILRGLKALEPGWRQVVLTRTSNDAYLRTVLPDALCLPVVDDAGRGAVHHGLPDLPDGERADLLFCPFTAVFHPLPGVPTVALVHDIQYAHYAAFFSPQEREERDRNFRSALLHADRLVTVSDFVRGTVLDHAGVEPDRVVSIHNSLADRLPPVDMDAAAGVLTRFGLRDQGYLIYPANPWPHKNHHMLLTAFGMYAARHPGSSLRLVLTGALSDPRGERLRETVAAMGLGDRVVLPGYVDDGALAALVERSLALIFPSLYEGFGIPVLEAMARGVPVLCSDRTSLPEVAGDAALLFDPRRPEEMVAAIARLEGDPALRRDLSERARANAARFGGQAVMAARYRDVFAEAIAGHRRLPVVLKRQGRVLLDRVVTWLKQSNDPVTWRLRHAVRNHLIRQGRRPGAVASTGEGTFGLYADGWAGDRVEFVVNRSGGRLTVKLHLPESVPHDRIRVLAFPSSILFPARRFWLRRGERRDISFRLGDGESRIVLRFDPGFRPVDWNHGPDLRYITCLCQGSVQ